MAQNNNQYTTALIEAVKRHRGRPAKYETADQLFDKFVEYINLIMATPYERNIVSKIGRGTKGDTSSAAKISVTRCPTLYGFCVFAGINETFAQYKKDCAKRKDGQDFSTVLYVIETTICDWQVQGAMVGEYSERLTARLNGIKEQSELDVNQRKTTISFEDYTRMLNGEKIE